MPDVLGRWDVLAVAGFLYAMEFVADKIPYVDSTWDAISTAIRPTAGAVIGVLLAGDADSPRPGGLRRGRRRHGAALPPGQGRQPARDQLLARAGHQHRGQRHRGLRRARRWSGSRSRTPGPRPRSPACCWSLGLVVLYAGRPARPARLAPLEASRRRAGMTGGPPDPVDLADHDVRAAVAARLGARPRRPPGDPRARRARRATPAPVRWLARARLPGAGAGDRPRRRAGARARTSARWSRSSRPPAAVDHRRVARPRPARPRPARRRGRRRSRRSTPSGEAVW